MKSNSHDVMKSGEHPPHHTERLVLRKPEMNKLGLKPYNREACLQAAAVGVVF